MSLRGPRFPASLPDAPAWVREGVARFEQVQRERPEDLGSDPSRYLRDGEQLYFPNAVMHWNAGMIGVVVAICGVAGCLTMVIVGAAFMGGVPGWSWIGLAGSLVLGLVSLLWSAAPSLKPGSLRRDGMYLLPEGAAFVRKGMCSWADRGAIEVFELTSISGSGSSYRESMKLKKGDAIELAAGKRPTLRELAENWRTQRGGEEL